MYYIDLGTEVAVLNSQVVPISQVVLKTDFTVVLIPRSCWKHYIMIEYVTLPSMYFQLNSHIVQFFQYNVGLWFLCITSLLYRGHPL